MGIKNRANPPQPSRWFRRMVTGGPRTTFLIVLMVLTSSSRADGFKNKPPGVVGTWSTPLVFDNELIMGFPTEVIAFAPPTGRIRWRCGGLNPLVYTSPIAGDGVIVVARVRPTFEVLAVNSMKEKSNSSLAASGGELFFRTDKTLWCIKKP